MLLHNCLAKIVYLLSMVCRLHTVRSRTSSMSLVCPTLLDPPSSRDLQQRLAHLQPPRTFEECCSVLPPLYVRSMSV